MVSENRLRKCVSRWSCVSTVSQMAKTVLAIGSLMPILSQGVTNEALLLATKWIRSIVDEKRNLSNYEKISAAAPLSLGTMVRSHAPKIRSKIN